MARLGRTPEQREIIGCYTLVVPVRVHISAEDRFDDVCRAVSASAKAASAHKSIGFTSIMKILKEEYGITEPSMYAFNWYSKVIRSDTPVRVRFSTSGEMREHLMWNVFAGTDGITSAFDYCEGVYNAERAEYLADSLCAIIKSGAENPAVREIPLTGEKETARLSEIFGTSYAIDDNATIPSLFRDAAKKYKDAPALYADGKSSPIPSWTN